MKLLLIALTFIGFTGQRAIAQEMTKVLFSSQEAQIRQQSPEIIKLTFSQGVSLSWLGTNETIKKVWLDNPSFVVADTDGCLDGLNEGCTGVANVLHLRRIEPLNLPNMPPSDHTLLTVVTENNGQGAFYVFKIVKSNSPSYLVYKVLGLPTARIPTTRDSILFNTLNNGIRIAKKDKFLADGSELDNKLSNLINELETGADLKTAVSKLNIDPDVINRLIELSTGGQNEI